MPAIEVPRRPPGARGLRLGCAAGLTLVVALCLCGVLVVGRILGFPSGGPAPAATPEPIAGSAVLLADSNTIAYTDPNGTCRAPAVTATESPTRVSLALSETDAGLGYCIRTAWPASTPVDVPLAAPLGSRQLVDAMTGNPVPYFDQRRGLHLVLDSGSDWSPGSYLPYGLVSTDSPYFRSPGVAIMVEASIHIDQTSDPRTISTLQLIQVSGGGWHPPPGTVTTPVTVRGHPGLAAAGIIVWTESGLTVALEGDGPVAATDAPDSAHGTPLDTAQLINLSNALGGGSS